MKLAPFFGRGRIRRLWLVAGSAGLLATAVSAFAVKLGDTYDQVIAEKGKPQNQIEAGNLRVLSYADVAVKLRDGVVVSLRHIAPAKAAAPSPSPTPMSPAAQVAVFKKRLDDAVEKVTAIINQPVPYVPRTRDMKIGSYLFHDGATRPDFATVDVRQSQELHYDAYDYITWQGHEDLAWPSGELEFNPMTKYFYQDRTVPKKKLTEEEMEEVNRLYRVIAACEQRLAQAGYGGSVP